MEEVGEELNRITKRRPAILGVGIISMFVIVTSIVLRFYARYRIKSLSFWWDDWLALATAVVATAFLCTNIAWMHVGYGEGSEAAADMDTIYTIINYQKATASLYAACIWLIKLSAIVVYARIFTRDRWFRIVLWVSGAIVTGWFFCTMIVPWFNCKPVQKTLDPLVEGECYERIVWFYGSAFMNAFLDLVVLLLPMPLVWRLQLTWRKKIAVTFVFLLGYCSAFLSFARFGMLIDDLNRVESAGSSSDMNVNNTPFIVVSLLESPFAVVALCAPAISQMTKNSIEKRRGTSLGSKSKSLSSGKSSSATSSDSERDHAFSQSNKPQNGGSWIHRPARAAYGTTTTVSADATDEEAMAWNRNHEPAMSLNSMTPLWDVEAGTPGGAQK